MTENSHSPIWPGVPLALASAALFGASMPLSKILLGSVDPQILAGLLYLGAGMGLSLVHVGRNAMGLPAVEAPLRRSDVPWMSAIILFGGVLGPLLLMLGLNQTDAASGSLPEASVGLLFADGVCESIDIAAYKDEEGETVWPEADPPA